MSSGYTPPAGDVAHFDFNDDSGYTPPAGDVAHFTRVTYHYPTGFDTLLFGTAAFAYASAGGTQYVTLNGTDFLVVWNQFGPYDVDGRREGFRYYNGPVLANGLDALVFGTLTVS